MNENDKILINAYLDGETSDDDSKYIESLLESSNKANEYANKIKNANNEINLFYESDDVKEVEKNISNFIKSYSIEPKSFSFEKTFRQLFTIPRVSTFALVSIIFLNFGYLSEDSLKEYEDKLVLTEVMKLRTGSNNLSNAFEMSLINMIDNKSKSGILIYGDEEFELSLNDFYKKNNRECFKGTANQEPFTYCRIDNEGELIFN